MIELEVQLDESVGIIHGSQLDMDTSRQLLYLQVVESKVAQNSSNVAAIGDVGELDHMGVPLVLGFLMEYFVPPFFWKLPEDQVNLLLSCPV